MAKVPIEDQKYLASVLSMDSIIKNRVVIIIGYAASVFKSIFVDDYHTITTSEEVKKFLSTYYLPNDKPLIFEDVSLMTTSVQTYLLKFIEDPPCPLVILASKDNISPVLLSRCKKIIKLKHLPNSQYLPLSTFIQDNTDLLLDNSLNEKSIYSKCPDFLYASMQVKEKEAMGMKKVLSYLKLL